jgi:hypothetical protein
MAGKMPFRLASIGGTLILVCLFGSVSLPRALFDSQTESNQADSIRYAKQIIWDLSPLPNQSVRSRVMAPVRHADLFHCAARALHLSTLAPPAVINHSLDELPRLQSLAVFNPTTRSPPV